MAVDWYWKAGYDFVALSDHNVLAEGSRFVEVEPANLARYRERFGDEWVEVDGPRVRLIALRGEKFFEVYNGHPLGNNEGDETRPSTERMWDILLAERLSRGEDVLFGIAVDDTHHYQTFDSRHVNPGRGWIRVRARELTAEALIEAMERGDFYGSSGVELVEVRATEEELSLVIREEPGVRYRPQFLGTRRGYDTTREPVTAEGDGALRYRYSDEIGVVLAEVEGVRPSYRFRGDESYVRAKVLSTKPKENPYREGEREAAWVQPRVPKR